MATDTASQRPDWFDSLFKRESYPHPVGDIRLLETHISWIVLTGEWAYKLKKPVNLGFVDFTTLELRHVACEAELRLNRRTAPTMYESMIPLRHSDDGFHFGEAGTIVEYAVRMHQFPEDAVLDKCLERHELTRDVLDVLAREIADLHLQAAVAVEATSYGSTTLMKQTVQACTDAVEARDLPPRLRDEVAFLKTWTEAEWQRLCPTLQNRKREGCVRECHGDLHLGNLVIYEGKPTLFDCLEFNPGLRWIDILSDIAFLVMDLHDRGVPDDAWYLLNRYLEVTGDFSGLITLRYFMTYRALVRAKVASIRLRQTGLAATEQEHQHAELESYLSLAKQLTQPDRASIVLMHGLCGSGKTRVALEIAASLPAIHIRSDVERKRLAGLWPSLIPINESLSPAELYSMTASSITYSRLEQLAITIVASGYSVIVDAAFLQRGTRRQFRELAAELSVPLIVVACTAPQAVLEERVRKRQSLGQDASDGDVAVLRQQSVTAESFDPSEQLDVIEVDTSGSGRSHVTDDIRKRLTVVP